MVQNLNPPVLISGMHRSFTSVFTHWLHECNLNIGEEFADASSENPTGYWEDLEFVRLHDKVLASSGLDAMSTRFETLVVANQHIVEAKSILESKSSSGESWGWKDPRTCILYRVLWKKVLDKHYIIALYRPFTEVVNSLMIRMLNDSLQPSFYKSIINKYDILSRQLRTPDIQKMVYEGDLHNHFLKIWIIYNQSLLDILDDPDNFSNSIVIKVDKHMDDAALLDFLKIKWGLSVKHRDFQEFWRKPHKSGRVNYIFDNELLDTATLLLNDLEMRYHNSRSQIGDTD